MRDRLALGEHGPVDDLAADDQRLGVGEQGRDGGGTPHLKGFFEILCVRHGRSPSGVMDAVWMRSKRFYKRFYPIRHRGAAGPGGVSSKKVAVRQGRCWQPSRGPPPGAAGKACCAGERNGAPNGIRIRAAGLKGRCPRPLDDGGTVPRRDYTCWAVSPRRRFVAGPFRRVAVCRGGWRRTTWGRVSAQPSKESPSEQRHGGTAENARGGPRQSEDRRQGHQRTRGGGRKGRARRQGDARQGARGERWHQARHSARLRPRVRG